VVLIGAALFQGIGILHTGIAYVLMYTAYPRLATPVIGGVTFIYPLVAILVDWLLYRHPLTWGQGTGMLLIAFGTLGVRLGWRFPRLPRLVLDRLSPPCAAPGTPPRFARRAGPGPGPSR